MNLRYLWRSVSLVLVVLFALSPTLCYASETVTSQTYTYDWREAERELLEYSVDSGGSTMWSVTDDDVANGLIKADFVFAVESPYSVKYISNPFSWQSPMQLDVLEFSSSYSSYNSLASSPYGSGMIFYTRFKTVDNDTIVDSGDSVNIKMSGIKHQMKYNYIWSWSTVNVGGGSGAGTAYYQLKYNDIHTIELELVSPDGQRQVLSIPKDDLKILGDTFGVDTDIQAPFDICEMNFLFKYPLSAYHWSIPNASSYHKDAQHTGGTGIFFQTNIYNGVLKITTPDESTGLLKGIIEWLKSIRDGIVNVANYVLELPSRIWTFIQEGLKMLFIPSESDITDMHSQWDNLMRDRFGAIYEAGDIVHQFGQTVQTSAIMAVDSGGVIELPSATVNLAGVPFTFGGYTVDIIPAGFEFLSNAVKSIVNIICTVIFLNMLRNKLEELIR